MIYDDFLDRLVNQPCERYREPRKEKGVPFSSRMVKQRANSIPDQSMHSDIVCSNMVSLIWTGSNVPDK